MGCRVVQTKLNSNQKTHCCSCEHHKEWETPHEKMMLLKFNFAKLSPNFWLGSLFKSIPSNDSIPECDSFLRHFANHLGEHSLSAAHMCGLCSLLNGDWNTTFHSIIFLWKAFDKLWKFLWKFKALKFCESLEVNFVWLRLFMNFHCWLRMIEVSIFKLHFQSVELLRIPQASTSSLASLTEGA